MDDPADYSGTPEARRWAIWLWVHSILPLCIPIVLRFAKSKDDPLGFNGLADIAIISPFVVCNSILGIRSYFKLWTIGASRRSHFLLTSILGLEAFFGSFGTIYMIYAGISYLTH